MSTQMITVTALVNAPIKLVWDRWTNPAHITKWNYASDDWHTTRAENDLKTGGKFLSRMEAKDGSVGFDFEGVYTNVEPLKTIEYSMTDGRKVRVSFDAVGENATKVTESFDPESVNAEEMQRAGWQAILDSFKNYTEGK